MASKLAQEASTEDIAEMLDVVDKTVDRLKTLYEQYFLGIQKQAPAYIHSDVERKLRDLTQLQIRNTGLRYRFTTIQSKFGSYNAYWRRTLRQIENGTYARNLHKIGRDAVRSGAEIPEEILAAMPKRMREQVVRDREQALAIAARRNQPEVSDEDFDVDLEDMPPEATDDLIAMIKEPTAVRRDLKTRNGAHIVDAADSELDIDAFFAEVEAAEPEAEPDHDDAHSTQKRAPVRVGDPRPVPESRPTVGQRPLPRPATDPSVRQPVDPHARTAAIAPIDPDAPRTTGQRPVVRPPTDPARTPVIRPPTDPKPDDAHARTAASAPLTPDAHARTAASAPLTPDAHARTAASPPLTPDAHARTAASAPLARPPTPAPVRPSVPAPARPGVPPARPQVPMPSQATKPNPIAPGAAAARGDVPVESMSGPFPRAPIQTPLSGMPALSKTPTGGQPAVPRPSAMTPSAGMPTIPRPNAAMMTPSGGMPAIPKPISSATSGPIPMPTIGTPSGPTPTTSTSGTAAPTTTAGGPTRAPSAPTTASSPTRAPSAPTTASGSTGAPSAPHTISRAATGPVPRAGTAPGGTTAPRPVEPVRPTRPDTSPGIPLDMDEETPAIVTQTRPTVRAQSPRPGTGPARAVTGQPTARAPSQPKPAAPPQRPPPGMTDADVNALYAKYVKAKEMVGEKIGPGEHHKLLKTINAQAPKIMQQYNAKAVDFSVVVKDNQVIIRAKPKT